MWNKIWSLNTVFSKCYLYKNPITDTTDLARKGSEHSVHGYNDSDDLLCANVCHCGDIELQINKCNISDELSISYNTVNSSWGKCLLCCETSWESSFQCFASIVINPEISQCSEAPPTGTISICLPTAQSIHWYTLPLKNKTKSLLLAEWCLK